MSTVLSTLAEGGQTWAHRVRMVRQVVKIALTLSFSVGCIYFLYQNYMIDLNYHISFWYYLKSTLASFIYDEVAINTEYWSKAAHEHYSGDNVLVNISKLHRVLDPYVDYWLRFEQYALKKSFLLSGYVLGIAFVFFFFRGGIAKKKKHISGQRIVPAWCLRNKLKISGNASSISIGNIPMLKNSETQHVLISGGTGTGKSTCIHEILSQLRDKGSRAVILDATGEYVSRYYREGKDVILNPFDERGVNWHPWIECKEVYDYNSIAESFIPTSNNENEGYWRTSAQTVFSALLEKTASAKSTAGLVQLMSYEPLSDLASYLEGTRAYAHVDPNSERTASSIRSVACSFIQCLEFLKDTDNPFSIRDWVQGDKEDSFLFICSSVAQRDTLRPLVSTWLSVAIKSLIQMTPDLERRLWFVIDEMPALQRIKGLETFVAEGRKYGGCGLFAIQSPAQLENIYGWKQAQVIIANCLTKVVFAEQDPKIAEEISKVFGSKEVKEFQEGISYGAHEMRDGVSVSGHVKNSPVISPTDIQNLKKFHAYLRLPGSFPISEITVTI